MKIKMHFENVFKGSLETDRGSLVIGDGENEFLPYELLPGALGSCYYATFLGIAEKQKIDYDKADIEISGKKREEVPTTLETVTLDLTIYGVDDAKAQKKITRAAELAGKYCSEYTTIGCVADMTTNVHFK